MKDSTLISLKIPKDLLYKVKLVADTQTTTVSCLIRQLLIEYVNK